MRSIWLPHPCLISQLENSDRNADNLTPSRPINARREAARFRHKKRSPGQFREAANRGGLTAFSSFLSLQAWQNCTDPQGQHYAGPEHLAVESEGRSSELAPASAPNRNFAPLDREGACEWYPLGREGHQRRALIGARGWRISQINALMPWNFKA